MAKQASRLLLYKQDASPPSCAVRMLGSILGLKFDYKEPQLLRMEHKSPDFKKINPMSTVPVLVDGDFIVSESHAIMKYLLNVYGGEHREKLYPSDARAQAIVDQCLYFDTGVMFVRFRDIGGKTLMGSLKEPTDKHKASLEEVYSIVEAYLQGRRYIAADNLTIADLSVGTSVTFSEIIHKVDGSKYPRSREWLSLLEEQPFFKEINAPGIVKMTKMLHHFWEKNQKKAQNST